MRRILSRFLVAAGALAAVACSVQSASAAPTRNATASDQAVEAEEAVPTGSSLAPLVERLRPSVVNISTITTIKHPPVRRSAPPQRRQRSDDFDDFFDRFFGGRPGPDPEAPEGFRGASLGSGFLLDTRGFILTNNHVVKDATEIRVRLSDGRDFGAKVIGRDPLTDVALIQLLDPPRDLPPAVKLGDSDVLRQGDFVLAMGSPFGLRDTVTLGIVSAKHRAGLNPGASYDDYIQTDAAINPGNSGGPLFNLRGEVVGINTLIVSPQIGQGIGFAVPISLAKALLPQLREKGKVTRGFLGVTVSDLTPELNEGLKLKAGTKGALVQNVQGKGPAEKAGLQRYDVITQLNGKPIESSGALTRSAAMVAPGEAATLTVLRNGEQKQLTLKVGTRPEDESLVGRADAPEEQAPEEKEPPPMPKLGIKLARITPDLQAKMGLEGDEGLVVTSVLPDGPADRVNIRKGDVILEVNQRPVRKVEDVTAILSRLKDSDVAVLLVRRGDQSSIISLRLGGK